jgi:signal transduction histidine kinase
MTPIIVRESEFSQEDVVCAIAREIRQPLGAIESIAYYLFLSLSGEDHKHRPQLTRMQQLIEQSNWMLANAVIFADHRRPEPQPVDLEELITQTISARTASIDPPTSCELAAELPLVHLDPGFGRALIENILGLFRQLATEAHPVQVRTTARAHAVELEVSTGAQGYGSLAALPAGSELSLDCARRIAMLHCGSTTHSIDPETGIWLRVMLP